MTPADTPAPTALDALLREVEDLNARCVFPDAYVQAPSGEYVPLKSKDARLAAIVRVLRGGLDRYAGIASGCLASVGGDAARTALARAEAIASGRDPSTTPNPTTHTIPADAPASDAGTQHKEP